MKFKKILIMLLLLANVQPINSHSANKIMYGDMIFEYIDIDSDELVFVKYVGNEENIEIPESIDGYGTIKAIGDAAFKDNQKIKNVTLPDSINSFGSEVFRNSSLVSVNIPKSLRIIPSYSFNNCSELETVIFHDDIVLMSNTAFKKTDIVVPPELYDKVTSSYIATSDTLFQGSENGWDYCIMSENGDIYVRIENYTGNDTEITVPAFINDVPVTEFKSKYGLSLSLSPDIKSITFPETITELNVYFSGSELEEITLPAIDEIPAGTFMNCKNLKTVNLQGNPETFTIGDSAFSDCNIDFVPYPESCKNISIGENAFQNTPVKEVRIDIDSSIGTDAFRECKNLSYVSLNNTHVGARAFRGCPTLEDVTVTGQSVLEEQTFYDCEMLKNITLSDLNVSMVNAVYNCPELMTINNKNAFDSKTGDFNKEFKEFIFSNFSGVDEVGFINMYVKAQAEKIVSEITTENMSDVQKIKAVHDWICKNTVYDDGLSGDRKNHNDASVLMNDSTVCEGYARIANILYNTAGIETYYISGVGHAWNVVRAGNNYFHVDTTWDDGDNISYDWFMKSDNEIRNSDGYHASWKTYIPSSLHSFQQGKNLPECTYSMGDVNQDNEISIADMVMLNKYILCQDNMSDDSYILSDLTADGIVDSFDLVRMRQLLIR